MLSLLSELEGWQLLQRISSCKRGATIPSSSLPARRHKADIISAVSSSPVTVNTGEPDSSDAVIRACTSRRKQCCAIWSDAAVKSVKPVARQASAERRCHVGGEVGYAVRF